MFVQQLLENDDFYRIRLPSDVLNASGRDYVISSVKAVSLKVDFMHVQLLICVFFLYFAYVIVSYQKENSKLFQHFNY